MAQSFKISFHRVPSLLFGSSFESVCVAPSIQIDIREYAIQVGEFFRLRIASCLKSSSHKESRSFTISFENALHDFVNLVIMIKIRSMIARDPSKIQVIRDKDCRKCFLISDKHLLAEVLHVNAGLFIVKRGEQVDQSSGEVTIDAAWVQTEPHVAIKLSRRNTTSFWQIKFEFERVTRMISEEDYLSFDI